MKPITQVYEVIYMIWEIQSFETSLYTVKAFLLGLNMLSRNRFQHKSA